MAGPPSPMTSPAWPPRGPAARPRGPARSPARSGPWPLRPRIPSTCWSTPPAWPRAPPSPARPPSPRPTPGARSSTFGPLGIIVVQGGNGTAAVAAPGIALASTKAALSNGQGLGHPHPAHRQDQEGRPGRAAGLRGLVRHHARHPTTGGGDPRVPGPVARSRRSAHRPGPSSARATSSRPWATSRRTPTSRPRSSPCSSSSTG